jgi:hypothetical protein
MIISIIYELEEKIEHKEIKTKWKFDANQCTFLKIFKWNKENHDKAHQEIKD